MATGCHAPTPSRPQLIGISPSAVSICNLPSIQVSLNLFGVTFSAQIAGPRANPEHRDQCHTPLAFDPTGRRRGPDLSPLAGTASLRLSFGCSAGLSDVGGFSRASITVLSCRDVSDQTIRVRVLDQRLVQSRWQSAGGEFGESHETLPPWALRPCAASHWLRCNVLSTDNISISSRVVDKLNTAFATKARANAERSDNGRPGRPDQPGPNASIQAMPRTLINCPLVFNGPRERVVEPGQKFLLNMEPVSAWGLFKRHRPRLLFSVCIRWIRKPMLQGIGRGLLARFRRPRRERPALSSGDLQVALKNGLLLNPTRPGETVSGRRL